MKIGLNQVDTLIDQFTRSKILFHWKLMQFNTSIKHGMIATASAFDVVIGFAACISESPVYMGF